MTWSGNNHNHRQWRRLIPQCKLNYAFFVLKVSVKAASGEGIPVTGIMLWDGPADGIASYNYITEDDWTLYICDCCQEDPAAEVWTIFLWQIYIHIHVQYIMPFLFAFIFNIMTYFLDKKHCSFNVNKGALIARMKLNIVLSKYFDIVYISRFETVWFQQAPYPLVFVGKNTNE